MNEAQGETGGPKGAEPADVTVKPHSYQPSKAELEADIHVDATPEQLRAALVRPVTLKTEE